MMRCSYSTSDTRRVIHVNNPEISIEQLTDCDYDKRNVVIYDGTSFEVTTLILLLGNTNSGISCQLRDIYFQFRCYWNGATHTWKFIMRKLKSPLLL